MLVVAGHAAGALQQYTGTFTTSHWTDQAFLRRLVAALEPVVRARAVRALHRHAELRAQRRDARQELDELTQEVMLVLFAREAKVLRCWDPARGLSLTNYVGMVAERVVCNVLRSSRRRPWIADAAQDCDDAALASQRGDDPETALAACDMVRAIHERLDRDLTPRAIELFELLFIEECTIEEAQLRTGSSRAAIYAWRSRLLRIVRQALEELEPVAGQCRGVLDASASECSPLGASRKGHRAAQAAQAAHRKPRRAASALACSNGPEQAARPCRWYR